MKAYVDQSGCIGCGLCASICPEVFEMNDDNIAQVICEEIPEDQIETAIEAQDGCPVSVITVE